MFAPSERGKRRGALAGCLEGVVFFKSHVNGLLLFIYGLGNFGGNFWAKFWGQVLALIHSQP